MKKYYKKVYSHYEKAFFDILKKSNRRDIFNIAIIMKRIKIINNNKRFSNVFNFYDVKDRNK